MSQSGGLRSFWKKLLRDDRGAVVIVMTIYLPIIVGLFTLAVDMSYVYYQRNNLQVTAEAAALAATTQLPDSANSIVVAKQYAEKNMPAARYGSVLKDADVIPGKWTDSCSAGGINCFVPAGSQSCSTFNCNAVKVTTRQSVSNGNALTLVFAPLIGLSTFDVTATAIAVFGPGPNSQTKWNAVIVEDITQSFSKQLANARAADVALLDCIKDNAAAGSKLGITLFTGVSPTPPYQSGISVSDGTNYTTLKNKISGINQCGSTGMPPCSGSNIAAGMNATLTQLCPNNSCNSVYSNGTKQAMIIVTDGIPNCGSTKNCSDSTLKSNAISAANQARADGIDVFTIYFGTNVCSDPNTCDSAWLATLTRGNGIALTTPDATKLSSLMQTICASSLSHRLVW